MNNLPSLPKRSGRLPLLPQHVRNVVRFAVVPITTRPPGPDPSTCVTHAHPMDADQADRSTTTIPVLMGNKKILADKSGRNHNSIHTRVHIKRLPPVLAVSKKSSQL